jgi:hypothetical protein
VGENQQPLPHAYQEDACRKNQGRTLLDKGSVPLVPDEDGPSSK